MHAPHPDRVRVRGQAFGLRKAFNRFCNSLQTWRRQLLDRDDLHKIQNAYESAGIWGMVFKNVPVAEHTYSGDPMKIDVSYRPNGIVKMLQAVSLDANLDGVKALSFSFPQLVTGISKKEVAGAELTAIVDDNLDRNDPEIDFALGILARTGITVAATAELPALAEKARVELMA